jgi:hypothetical protein
MIDIDNRSAARSSAIWANKDNKFGSIPALPTQEETTCSKD